MAGPVLSLGRVQGINVLRQLLYKHAEDAGRPGRDPVYGAGLIRPEAMLEDISISDQPPARPGEIWVWIPKREILGTAG